MKEGSSVQVTGIVLDVQTSVPSIGRICLFAITSRSVALSFNAVYFLQLKLLIIQPTNMLTIS
jgi:hypothetical protein